MQKEEFEGYTYIDGGVCAARGFLANGLNCGLNPNKEKNDLALVYSEGECQSACVYTSNKVKGAPITVTKKNLEQSGGISRAVIANSKNANTCNDNGIEIANGMCQLVEKQMGIPANQVIVASTGVIGMKMELTPFENAMEELAKGLTRDGNLRAETAIMTTDTVPKEVAVSFELDGITCHMGGMGKGSGMINPHMATTLNFITTDVNISSEMLQKALDEVVQVTYNCLTVDGDMSTNDMVSVMANGFAGNSSITAEGKEYEIVKQALYIVMLQITKMLAKDGEGATKFLECQVKGAPSLELAVQIAKSVAGSTLLKCAIFGADANWGRVACAVGYTPGDFEVDRMDVDFVSKAGVIPVGRNGFGIPFSEEEALKVLSEDEITVVVDLHYGENEAKAWGCDMTYDYVKINGDYRS